MASSTLYYILLQNKTLFSCLHHILEIRIIINIKSLCYVLNVYVLNDQSCLYDFVLRCFLYKTNTSLYIITAQFNWWLYVHEIIGNLLRYYNFLKITLSYLKNGSSSSSSNDVSIMIDRGKIIQSFAAWWRSKHCPRNDRIIKSRLSIVLQSIYDWQNIRCTEFVIEY